MCAFKFIDLENQGGTRKAGTAIVRLMSVCNDIAMANICNGMFKNKKEHSEEMSRGARMYFVRLEIAHFFEGLDILSYLNKSDNNRIQDVLNQLPTDIKNINTKLSDENFTKDNTYKMMAKIRNKLSFHYDCDLYKKGLRERVENSSTTDEYEPLLSLDIRKNRFCGADDIIDTALCRHILEQEEIVTHLVDELLTSIFDICRDFYNLAYNIITLYENYESPTYK